MDIRSEKLLESGDHGHFWILCVLFRVWDPINPFPCIHFIVLGTFCLHIFMLQEPSEGSGTGAADPEPAGSQGIRLSRRGRVPTVS